MSAYKVGNTLYSGSGDVVYNANDVSEFLSSDDSVIQGIIDTLSTLVKKVGDTMGYLNVSTLGIYGNTGSDIVFSDGSIQNTAYLGNNKDIEAETITFTETINGITPQVFEKINLINEIEENTKNITSSLLTTYTNDFVCSSIVCQGNSTVGDIFRSQGQAIFQQNIDMYGNITFYYGDNQNNDYITNITGYDFGYLKEIQTTIPALQTNFTTFKTTQETLNTTTNAEIDALQTKTTRISNNGTTTSITGAVSLTGTTTLNNTIINGTLNTATDINTLGNISGVNISCASLTVNSQNVSTQITNLQNKTTAMTYSNLTTDFAGTVTCDNLTVNGSDITTSINTSKPYSMISIFDNNELLNLNISVLPPMITYNDSYSYSSLNFITSSSHFLNSDGTFIAGKYYTTLSYALTDFNSMKKVLVRYLVVRQLKTSPFTLNYIYISLRDGFEEENSFQYKTYGGQTTGVFTIPSSTTHNFYLVIQVDCNIYSAGTFSNGGVGESKFTGHLMITEVF